MSLPFALPDWLPWWVPLAILVPALLYALVFLFMPFSVIGLRGRLDSIDARLDEIQGEIRSLALRLREPLPTAYDDAPVLMPAPPPREEYHTPTGRPPIPPAPHYPDAIGPADPGGYRGARAAGPRRAEPPPRRAEPRLDWPR
jgi:hypothetical protein